MQCSPPRCRWDGFSQVAEQSEAALFLVSDRAAFASGASLLVDGGLAYVNQ
jgi:hypothetical protein